MLVGCLLFAAGALACFILAVRQLRQKGPLLNNAWFYASDAEREKLDKKPYYVQSGVSFLFVGAIFAVNALSFLLQTEWFFFVALALCLAVALYAILSTAHIARKK